MRKGNFIITYSRILFYPLDPRIEEIKTEDIAHALALTCRFNGHCLYFYSVAHHSINCCEEAKLRNLSKRIQLACLLHDGSEAYISDITRPVKPFLTNYKEIETNLQTVIFSTYGLNAITQEETTHIKTIDDNMLNYEGNILFPVNDCYPKQQRLHKSYDLISTPEEIKQKFMDLLRQLT